MKKTNGVLVLVPTPIAENVPLEGVAFSILEKACLEEMDQSVFVIEDLKPGRKRWLSFKLPRSAVDHFKLYNEHTAKEVVNELLSDLKSGKNVYLMSDGGLPAFYDPGVELVNLCHQNKIKVTATPFANSVALALALSGFSHQKFWFEGFLPLENDERIKTLKNLYSLKNTAILMDTPYRLKRVLEECQEVQDKSSKRLFLAMDLGSETEECLRGTPVELLSSITELRREFVLVISQ